MVTNWCKEHEKVWFKTKNMRGFAHPVEENGEPVINEETGKPLWCNRPKDWEEPTQPSVKPQEPLEIAPQERGMWFKELGECIRGGFITREEIFGKKNKVALALWQSYFGNMMVGLSIKAENKDENS